METGSRCKELHWIRSQLFNNAGLMKVCIKYGKMHKKSFGGIMMPPKRVLMPWIRESRMMMLTTIRHAEG